MAWEFTSENAADSGALGLQHAKEEKEAEESSKFNKGVAEIMGRHLLRQANKAEEINAVPAPELPQGFEPGTGESVTLDQPLPPRNNAPGGLLPLSVPGAKVLRGYTDAEGNVTPAGKQFFHLYKEGLFDDEGQLTEKGKAFTMDADAALQLENLPAFIERDKAGLNREDSQTWGQIFSELVQTVADTAVASDLLLQRTGIDNFYNPIAPFRDRTSIKEAEQTLASMAFAEGAIENTSGLGSGMASTAQRLAAWITGNDDAAYKAKQSHAAFKREMADAGLAEYAAGLIGSADLLQTLQDTETMAADTVGPGRAAELMRQGQNAGSILADPITLATMGTGAAIGAASKSKTLLQATAATDRALVARAGAAKLAEDVAGTQAALARTETAATIAAQRAADLKNIGQLDRASRLEATAGRLSARTAEGKTALAELQAKAAVQAEHAADLTAKAGGAETLVELAEAGRQFRRMPAEAIGSRLEAIGDGIVKMSDDLAAHAKDRGWDDLASVAGTGLGLLAGGVPGAAVGGLIGKLGGQNLGKVSLAGKFIQQMGRFTRAAGKEAMQTRGSVPFWQRVANNTELNPLSRATAHLVDMGTLGGRAAIPFRAARKGVAGAAAAAPLNIVFETVADGGDLSPDAMKRALASSMVFGGGTAALGGLVQGSLLAKRQKEVGNELNFRRNLGEDGKASFEALNKGSRRIVSEVAAAFPDLGWKFTNGQTSFYDPRANAVVVGMNTNRLMEALLAHEVSHSITVKGQMEPGIIASLVGDGATGGLLRSKDGTLDPDFSRFMEAYNKDAQAAGLKPLNVEEAAVEYFTDSTVQDVLGMVDSGELQRMAGRTEGARAVSALSRAVIDRLPLLSDLFYKMGGATDKGGNLVQGSGIMGTGIREVPGAKAMLRRYLREKAGRRDDFRAPKDDKGAVIPMDLAKKSKPLMDSMFSVFETDADGNVIYDAGGSPKFITRELEKQRATAGKTVAKSIEGRILNGETPPKGQMRPDEKGEWSGEWLPDYAIKDLGETGVFNGRQMANLRMLNTAAKRNKGELFALIYQPATIKRPGKRAAYGSLAPTFRDVVPLAFSVTGQGNFLVHLFSATQFERNVNKRAQAASGKGLYDGNTNAIKADAYAMMEAHRQKGDSYPYFVEKYGAKDARSYQNFINSIFATHTKRQREVNPLFAEENINDARDAVYKTYRLDRINQATRLNGVPMPFNYEMMRERMLPPGFRFNIAPNGLVEPRHSRSTPAAPRQQLAPLLR